MFKEIIFFELRHYGDLHITRNFVKYVIKNIQATRYTYVLTIDSKVFSDIQGLIFEEYNPQVHPFTLHDEWKIENNILYINTSCGTKNMAFFQGTTIQTAHTIFRHYLQTLCAHIIPDDLRIFIPTIDFSKFRIESIDAFMVQNKDRKKILIVNGDTQSGQVINFDLYPVIQILAHEFPQCMFFVSNPIENISYRYGCCRHGVDLQEQYNPGNNIYLCKNIINIPENDIVESAYFSLFCDVIVGRSSGVYTLSIERTNVTDHPKKFICFCHFERDKDLGVSSIIPEMAPNFTWNSDYNYSNMLNIIIEHIKACYV